MTVARIVILADNSDANAKLAETAEVAKKSSEDISNAGTSAGTKFGDAIDDGTTKAGNRLQRLSTSLGNWGVPFSSSLGKVGDKLAETETKGQKFIQTMSSLGGATLGIGAVAFAAIGAESIHMADQFDTAQTSLEVAIKNSGNTWAAYKAPVDAAYSSLQKLGFENTDVAQALQTLTTATNSPKKALDDIGLAANIARMRHESLSDAAQQLTRILGGNTRILAQWGINLDIGSGKLHSIQSAEEALQKAQLNLNTIQGEIADGQKTGAEAAGDLAAAQESVRNATLNLSESQKAIPDIMAALKQRTDGVATAFGKTLPGQIDILRAGIHNLGTEFGEWLTPKLITLEHVLADVIGWFNRNKVAGEAVAAVIGGVLGTAVTVFAVNKMVALGSSLQKGVTWLTNLGQSSASTATSVTTSSATTSAAVEGIGTTTETTAVQVESSNSAVQLSFEGLGAAAESGAGTAEVAMSTLAANVASDDAAIEASNATAEASFSALAGAATAAGVAIVALEAVKAAQSVSRHPGILATPQTLALAGRGAAFQAEEMYLHGYMGNGSYTGGIPSATGPDYLQAHGSAQIDEQVRAFLAQRESETRGTSRSVSTPGSKIPSLGGIPSAGDLGAAGSSTASTLQTSALSLLQSFQSAIQAGTATALRKATTDAMSQKLQLMVSELVATHNGALVSLADQLVAAFKQAQSELNQVLEIQQETALADQTQLMATELKDQTTLMSNVMTAQAQIITDKATTQADIISERGLFGLNLAAQVMKVKLDEITTGFDTTIAKDQKRVDSVTKTQDAAIQAAQTKVDLAATGSELQQEQAAAVLKEVQAHAAYAEAQASAILAKAQDNAKVAEAQQQALIAIEEAKAAHQFAGSGFHVTIVGLQPNDAQAVASAVGFVARNKLKV